MSASHAPARTRSRSAWCTAALAALLLPLLARPAARAEPLLPTADARPNVLVVRTDDQVAQRLSGLAASMPFTAAWFARNGVEFTRSYVSSPSCCQSRASSAVGRYPHNEGVWSQGGGAALDARGSLASYLHRAGYRTTLIGKYLNLVTRDLPGFDRWTSVRGTCPTSDTEFCQHGDGPVWYYGFTVSSNDPLDPPTDFVVPGSPRTGSGYNTVWSGERLRRALRQSLAQHRPWYVEWDPTAPHTHDGLEAMVEPAYRDLAVPGCHPPVEVDRDDKPPYVRAWTAASGRFGAQHVCPTAQRALRSVDDQFRAAVDLLRSSGALTSTLIVFTSDNGLMNGEHDMTRKLVPYEPSVRVPLMLSWPGHLPPGTDDGLVSNLDLLPTVLQATGTPVDPALPPPDGRSLLDRSHHSTLLAEYRVDPRYATSSPAQVPTWASWQDTRAAYVETYADELGTQVAWREYYDLVHDPDELDNLLAHPGSSGLDVAALHARLQRLRHCKGTSGPAACP